MAWVSARPRLAELADLRKIGDDRINFYTKAKHFTNPFQPAILFPEL